MARARSVMQSCKLVMILFAALVCGLAPGNAAEAAGRNFSSASFYVFVPSGSSPSVSVIDKTSDRMIGRISLPLIPSQIVVSEVTHTLAAIDGMSPRVALVDLASAQSRAVDLTIVPQRLWLDNDKNRLAAADLWHGEIVFVDLASRRQLSQVNVAGPIRDVLFSDDGSTLFVAADGISGVGVIDVARAQKLAAVPPLASGHGHVTGLTRSPDGLTFYAADEAGIAFDFEQKPDDWRDAGGGAEDPPLGHAYRVRQIGKDFGVAKAFPTGYGEHIVEPNNRTGSVTLVAAETLQPKATLRGLAQMSTAYSGWFDEVSIIASATEHKLLVVDLDRWATAGEIELPGAPGPGDVTSDGDKLYVPVPSANEVAVIDLRNRRLVGAISVDANPTGAVVTRSFDVCH
jgi:DNA-binding beta-propeller fold protein YncE